MVIGLLALVIEIHMVAMFNLVVVRSAKNAKSVQIMVLAILGPKCSIKCISDQVMIVNWMSLSMMLVWFCFFSGATLIGLSHSLRRM